ncbi:larval cuticle protein LCP-17-like [Trichoplusia ni]|uniref:Larval cuticle protein LCP-17-like n=1 Tax=Trichoplusia ni TaxID=7111 RepID=A0A7E5W222_TRINI|nr:larval cuticle protein LCP-17-like [Trichoplusia ni]
MKSFVAILALVALAAADVSHLRSAEADAQILAQEADVFPDQYSYNYKTSNGIAAQESGALTNVGTEGEAISVAGQNSYTAPGGEQISLSYIADANGYQPQGAHLPTPHPIPEEILKSLEYIRTHPAQETRKL